MLCTFIIGTVYIFKTVIWAKFTNSITIRFRTGKTLKNPIPFNDTTYLLNYNVPHIPWHRAVLITLQIAKEINETRITQLSSLLKLWAEELETLE